MKGLNVARWFYIIIETSFINNSRSKQNKKKLKHHFVDAGKTQACAKLVVRRVSTGTLKAFDNFKNKHKKCTKCFLK